MRLPWVIYPLICFIIAACLCVLAAGVSVRFIEEASKDAINKSFKEAGLTWAHAEADGLQVFVIGDAIDDAERFQAISVAGSVVDAARLVDQTVLLDRDEGYSPNFSLEILKNISTVSVIGLMPTTSDRAGFLKELAKALGSDKQVSDLIRAAAYPSPLNWEPALRLALEAVEQTEIAKIAISAGSVSVETIANSLDDKRKLQTSLGRSTPKGVALFLKISVPRPVISPFVFRAIKLEEGFRLEACSALDAEVQGQILKSIMAYAFEGKQSCQIGLGMPDVHWPKAIQNALKALDSLAAGSLTITDTEIKLVADAATPQKGFDLVIDNLNTVLPDFYTVQGVLPKPKVVSGRGQAAFIATLSPEGLAQFRGPIKTTVNEEVFQSLAKARFGKDAVYTVLSLDDNLPTDWSIYVMAGVEALSLLKQGIVTITLDEVEVRGRTEHETAKADITNQLIEKLPQGHDFRVKVEYAPPRKIEVYVPSAQECLAQINGLLSERKINFEPGSDRVNLEVHELLDDLADVFKACGEIPLEIAGHTDSQGREEMNQKLSQSRAQAVLVELQRRRILTSSFVAKGYGESQPIAPNDTEDGREINRRIEFNLIHDQTNLQPDDLAKPQSQPKEAADEQN
ncbi:MAG: OmpA family protein [Paracoccaceae bacterium]